MYVMTHFITKLGECELADAVSGPGDAYFASKYDYLRRRSIYHCMSATLSSTE